MVCLLTGRRYVRTNGKCKEAEMLALIGVISIAGGTCLACGATATRLERHLDLVSGVLLVAGLAIFGSMVPAFV